MIQGASASPSGAGPKSLLEQYLANVAERRSEEDYFAPLVFRAASRWLEENYQSEKFFLVVDSFDPHEPWDPPAWYTERYDPGYSGREIITPRYGDISYLSEAELRHMRALYAGEVTMTDTALGQFLDHARRLGVLDRSLVIFLADHGHSLGEHGVTGKLPYSMYPELLDIPFMIRHPDGTGAGRVVDALLYNHDVVPTILEATGVTFPTEVDGQSLLPWVTEGRGPAREHLSLGFHNFVWVTDGEWALLVRSDGEMPRLYHLPDDPQMRHDVADGESARVRQLFDRARDDAGGDFPYYGEWGSIRAAADWYRSP